MADNWETIVNVKTVGDTKGADDVARSQEKIGHSAEKASRTATNSFRKIIGSLTDLRAAGARVKQMFTTFTQIGFVASGVESVVNLVDRLTASSRKAKDEAKKLADEQRKMADAKTVRDVAKAYEMLGEAIAQAARERQRANELDDIGKNNARDLEDKEAQLAKLRAINALDPNDPQYEQKKAVIERKFEEASARRDVTRAREDNETNADRLKEEGIAKHGAAGVLEDSLREDDRLIEEKRRRARRLHEDATEDNEYDESFGANAKTLLSLEFGKWASGRTNAGDEERKRLEAEAKELDEEVRRLQEARDEKAKRVAAMREEGDHLIKKGQAIDDQDANFEAAEKINAEKEDQPRVQRMAAYRTLEEKGEDLARLHRDKEYEQARAQAAADNYTREQADVFNAQNRYDMLVANGGSRKDRSAALAALQKEQREAEEAKHEMERVAAEVANTLQGISAQIKALASAVKKAEGRLAQNQADAPEG